MPIYLTISFLFGFDLIRVDVPDHPDAIASSEVGSTLWMPPAEPMAWREEPIPVTDTWAPTHAIDAIHADAWHEAGWDGEGIRIAVFDVQWYGVELHDSLSDLPTHDCFAHRSCGQAINTLRTTAVQYEQRVHR